MIVVAPDHGLGALFGAGCLSSDYGTGKFDPKDKLGVLKDEYGLKGARSLGRRVAEVTKLVKNKAKVPKIIGQPKRRLTLVVIRGGE